MTVPNKKLLLGITGGIAAYKTAELARLLVQDGIDVQVVMTEAARQFITPVTMQALSGNPVYSDLWDTRIANSMAHIDLSRDRNFILIAPASADFIAKLANGFADDLLSTLCLARECPLMVAPAMNLQMWEHPATRRNIARLQQDGVAILGPAIGDQACGETGAGRMLEAVQLAEAVALRFQPRFLRGQRIIITAGPTYEAIDAVRGITNMSSGKMGYAIARAALEAGARVTLISGPTALPTPTGANRIDVTSAAEMLNAVNQQVKDCDIFIAVAAVADYHVSAPQASKIKKNGEVLTLQLEPNVDILATVAGMPRPPFCVGFAAETENLEQYAEEKRRAKKVPLLVANLAQNAGSDENELMLLDDTGTQRLPRASKLVLARQLMAHIAKLYRPA